MYGINGMGALAKMDKFDITGNYLKI